MRCMGVHAHAGRFGLNRLPLSRSSWLRKALRHAEVLRQLAPQSWLPARQHWSLKPVQSWRNKMWVTACCTFIYRISADLLCACILYAFGMAWFPLHCSTALGASVQLLRMSMKVYLITRIVGCVASPESTNKVPICSNALVRCPHAIEPVKCRLKAQRPL